MLSRYFLKLIGVFLISVVVCSSCGDTPKADNKNNPIVKKENELPVKEAVETPGKPGNEMANTEAPEGLSPADNLEYLKKFNGEYPYKVKLFNDSNLVRRLQKLLDGRYQFLAETWSVEPPIEIRNNTFIASGCQQHNCGSTNFMIVIDFTKNVLYAGIREEEVVQVYSEDGSSNPEITNWAENNQL